MTNLSIALLLMASIVQAQKLDNLKLLYKKSFLLLLFFITMLISNGLLAQPNCEKAQKFTHPNGQAKAFGADFYLKKCQCVDQGVSNKQDEQTLIGMMKYDRDNYIQFGGNSSDLGPIPTGCKMNLSNGKEKDPATNSPNLNYDNGVVVKDEYLDLLGSISENSKNQHFKNMVGKMQENRQAFSQGRSLMQTFGVGSQKDIDLYNQMENIYQGIEIAKFIYKTVTHELTPEQKAARQVIQSINSDLKYLYGQISGVPTFYDFNPSVLDKLNQIENQIAKYESATATRRLLYLEYWHTKPYMTEYELTNRFNEIENLKQSNGNEYLLSRISELETSFKRNEFLHIVDKEFGFAVTYNKIKLTEALYYEKNGQPEKATVIRKSINYNIDDFEAFKLLSQSFQQKNYYGCLQYYDQVKEIIRINEKEHELVLRFSNIPSIDFETMGVTRTETMYLIALGVLSNSIMGNSEQAVEELNFLKWCNENHRAFNAYYKTLKARKKTEYSDSDYEQSYANCLAIEKAVEATLLAKNDEFKKAEQLIDEAITLNLENADVLNKFENWFLLTKLDILIRTNNFIEAKRTAIQLKTKSLVAFNAKLFNADDFKFLVAFMDYKQGNMQSALNILTAMEAQNPTDKRILLLKSDIYKQKNDTDAYNKYQEKLINL